MRTPRGGLRISPAALALCLLVLLAGGPSDSRAGGPRAVNGLGVPMRWAAGTPIIYNPDPGPLGLLSNSDARALLAQAFAVWDATPADLSFQEGALLPVDVHGHGLPADSSGHYKHFYRVDGDGLSPVIFDDDGSVIDSLFGIGARFDVLGVAGLDDPLDGGTTITGASIVINGAFYDGVGLPDSPDDLTLEGLKAAMVHEIGHFINLDHSVLNHELALDDNAGNDIYVPTMFPLSVRDEGALATLNPDDARAAEALYPDGPSSPISGSVTFAGTPFQGANVVLRRVGDPLMTAYSVVSGGLYFPCNPPASCTPDPQDPNRGAFSAAFLAPGSYTVCVEQIDTRFSVANGTFVGPLATPPILPGPEECYDAGESGTSADDPDDATTAVPGFSGANIQLNALPSSDPLEPNDTLATGSTLADLPGGSDTVPGFLATGDLDVYNVPVTAGQIVRIDVDAAELGSPLDAIAGFYNAANQLVAISDDAIDPDTGAFSLDPALELVATFTGTAKVVISSFPDNDQNGIGGSSTGGYWLRVEVLSDTDGDGVPDVQDICPTTARDDADRDGLCFGADNCPTIANPGQQTPGRLNAPLAGDGVIGARFSADGARVVYLAPQDTAAANELYSVPIGGGATTKLNGTLPTFGRVQDFRITPDGAQVVYTADQVTAGKTELFIVPIAGGTAMALSGTLTATQYVQSFDISPNSAQVVFLVHDSSDGRDSLYSAPTGGGTVTTLWTHAGDWPALDFKISPDSLWVVYRARTGLPEVELFSGGMQGGSQTQLNKSIPGGGGVQDYRISGRNWVVYTSDQDTAGLLELYSVPAAGGSTTKLNQPLVAGGAIPFLLTRNALPRVVYTAREVNVGAPDLYSVTALGGLRVHLNSALPPGAIGVNPDFVISPDGTRVVYAADVTVPSNQEIFSAPILGGAAVKLSGPGTASGAPAALGISPDSANVVFAQTIPPDSGPRVYSTPILGGTRRDLSGAADASGVNVTADSRFVVYSDSSETFGVPILGGRPVHLAGPGADPIAPESLSPDGSWVVYIGKDLSPTKKELFRVSPETGSDADGDGILSACDDCPFAADTSQTDADGNGLGDACQPCAQGTDPDADGVCGAVDNCPDVANSDQADFDGDGAGDACDADDDNDGLPDDVETGTGTYVDPANTGTNPRDADSDHDGVPDGQEVLQGTDPNNPNSVPGGRIFGGRNVIPGGGDGPVAIAAADLDGDGDIDTLSFSANDHAVVWHENNGATPPGWTTHVIDNAADGYGNLVVADFDGDGDLDVLAASFIVDEVVWYENNGTPAVGTWPKHSIGIAIDATSVAAADIDGDGDLDALVTASFTDQVIWFENDGTPANGTWTPHVIASTADYAYWVWAADVNGDGTMDVISASVNDNKVAWYENDGTRPIPGWTAHTISTLVDGAEAAITADLDGDGDLDVVSAAANGDSIFWHENGGQHVPTWVQHTITTTADAVRWLAAADLDHDGDLDVLAASRNDNTVAWYENDGASPPGFRFHALTTTAQAADSVAAADLDGDGDLDILFSSELDDTVGWFENRTPHSTASFAAPQIFSHTAASYGAFDIVAADIDGDGDLDAVSGALVSDTIIWHENTGGGTWVDHVLPFTIDDPEQIAVADLDHDGDPDIVTVSYLSNSVWWFENHLGTAGDWTMHTIPSTGQGTWGLALADFDGDGDIDVAAASRLNNQLSWYENDGTPDDDQGWIQHDFPQALPGHEKRGLAAADMDGDGHVDLLAVEYNLSHIRWYRNDGNVPPSFTEVDLSPSGGPGTPNYVSVGDINGDGHLDVVTGGYAASYIAWYENDGNPSPAWTLHMLPENYNGWMETHVVDIDGDGDQDIVSTSALANVLQIWENDGAANPGFSRRTYALSEQPGAVFPADIDGDGDLDLLATFYATQKVGFFENQGGQAVLDTFPAPGLPVSAPDGSTAPLLSIRLTSNGRPGDSPVELATLALEFRDGTNRILSNEEVNGLVERLRVYADLGTPGVFEPGIDPLVATVETLQVSPQRITFVPGDPRVRVNAGASRSFFVTAELSPTASAHGVASFLATHLTMQSEVRDTGSGSLVRLAGRPTAGTWPINVLGDVTAPFVTRMDPADRAVDVSPSTAIVLQFSEPVDPDTASLGVALYHGGQKVPARIGVDGSEVGIDPDAPLLPDADYIVQVTAALHDRDGNPAVPFTGTFDTGHAGTSTINAGNIGAGDGGAALPGTNASDQSGSSAAALGDVNGTIASHGIADLLIGAPNADAGAVDTGKATLVFGDPGLRSNAAPVATLSYTTGTANDYVGETVAAAGDANGDGVSDFLIGAPHSDQAGTDAGVVYLVFGHPDLATLSPATLDLDNLAACTVPTLCGVKFLGAAPGDLAGMALSRAGDVDGDGHEDLLIGAPGASPSGRTGAGRVYLLFGPLAPGTIPLAAVGASVRGLVFNGETAGDSFGSSVSQWTDPQGDGFDDLLIGAPGASTIAPDGSTAAGAGLVYAIQGGLGPGHLVDTATPGVIEASRVANGGLDQVAGMVFIGDTASRHIGRSVTGAVDIDGNGVYDILISGDGVAFAIPGDDPKTRVGSTNGPGTTAGGGLRAGLFEGIRDFGLLLFTGTAGNPLTIGPAGDLNHDGFGDFIVGDPLADPPAKPDAGRAYIVLGSPTPGRGARSLDDVGLTIDGFVVEGAAASDHLGASVGGGEDLNADGVDDGLVGAPYAEASPLVQDAGETYIISPVLPDEVVSLSVGQPAPGTARLEWSIPRFAVSYNIYRGLVSALKAAGQIRTSGMTQLACHLAPADADHDLLPDYDDGTAPPIGNGWYYLVTATNALGEGPLGTSRGAPPPVNDLQCP